MKRDFIPENLYQEIISRLPIAAVDLVVKMKKSFLLVKRLEGPAKNQWWFPGGRILIGESLIKAAKRKLREELNINNFRRVKFLGVGETKFKRGRFNKPIHSINNVFLVELNGKESSKIRTDRTISKYKWFNDVQKGWHSYIKEFLKLAGFN